MNSRGTVLILDNDEFALIELERVLEDAGFNTTTTWNLSKAVQLLSSNHYGYVLVGECFSENKWQQLLHQGELGERTCRWVTLSVRDVILAANFPVAAPIIVCKHRSSDVLRALSAGHNRALAHAA